MEPSELKTENEIHPTDPHALVVKKTKTQSDVLQVKLLSKDACIPRRATSGSAGYDLASPCDCIVPPHGKELIKLELSIAIPEGYYGRIAPRSSLAWKNFIHVGAGVIDCDYRGCVGVVLFNHHFESYVVKKGDKIAQLIIEKIATPDVVVVDDLSVTVRGSGGYGSTGKSHNNEN